MAITDKDIHETAEKLIKNGISPTLANIRKELGGGSFTTISEAMKDFRAKKAKVEALADIKEPAPESITTSLNNFGADIWEIAQALATDRLKSEREALEVARGEYEASAKEVGDLADSLSFDLEEKTSELEELTAKHEALVVTNADLLKKSEDQDKEITGLSASVVSLQDEVKALGNSNKSLSIENAKLSGHVDDLEKEKKGNLLIISQLNEKMGELKANFNNAQENYLSMQKERDELKKLLSVQQNKELEQSNARNDTYSALINKLDTLRCELDETTRERDSLEFDLANIKNNETEQ